MYIDLDTEKAVLACMIISNECAYDHGLLSIDDFTDENNKIIYTGIQNLVTKNKNVDYLSIHNELNKKITLTYLANLDNLLPTTANFTNYTEKLRDLTLKRKLYLLAGEIRNPNLNGEELAELAEKGIYDLREETSTSEFTKLNEILLQTQQKIKDVSEGKVEPGLKTGYTKLDEIIGGLRKKEYILLGARPSIGKTALAINITENLLIQNKSVAFFSFEMSEEQVVERLLKGMALVKTGYEKPISNEEYTKLDKASHYLLNKNLFIDDNPNKSVSEMQSMCRKLKRKEGLDLVVIDYLQKVKSNIRGSKREQLEQTSNDIKNMAKNLDVPVVVVSSLSRANETREIKVPILSDLRETGQLEFDADVVMFLHRDYYYNRSDDSLKNDADAVIAKNRNGKIGRTKLNWVEDYTKFFNIEMPTGKPF